MCDQLTRAVQAEAVDDGRKNLRRRGVHVHGGEGRQRGHERTQASTHAIVEAPYQGQFRKIGQRAVGDQVGRLQRQINGIFGAALRLRLAVGVDPVHQRARERRGQIQQGQQALKVPELYDVDLSTLHQIVEVEQALLIFDVTGEFAGFDRHRRQPQCPGLAEMIDVAEAAIVAQYRAGPIHASQYQGLRLNMIGREFAFARPGALRDHHRRRRHGGQRDYAHGENDGHTELSRSHEISANKRTSSSPEARTMRSRTARGIGGSDGEPGQASTHAKLESRYCNSKTVTPASTG